MPHYIGALLLVAPMMVIFFFAAAEEIHGRCRAARYGFDFRRAEPEDC